MLLLGRKTAETKKQTKSINKSLNWKSVILIALLITILICLLIAIQVLLSRGFPSSADHLTSSKISISNKFDAQNLIKIVKRDEWCKMKSIQGKKKLSMPVPKVIIMQTFTKKCETKVNYIKN